MIRMSYLEGKTSKESDLKGLNCLIHFAIHEFQLYDGESKIGSNIVFDLFLPDLVNANYYK